MIVMGTAARRRLLFFIPQLRFGGVASVLLRLVNGLAMSGFDILVAVGEGDEELIEKISSVEGVSVHCIGQEKARGCIAGLASLIRNRSFDSVVGVQSHATWVLVIAAFIAQYGGRIISWEHSTPSRSMASMSIMKRIILSILARIFYMRVSKVVAVSDGVASDVVDYFGLSREKVITLRSPIYDSQSAVVNVKFEAKKKVVRFLSVGRLSIEKGISDLLQAFNRLPEDAAWQLTIVGDGAERIHLEEYVDRNTHLREKVNFVGFTTKTDSWYRESDVFVMSSYYEGLPTVLIEASLYGLPLVSTDCESGPREIIVDGVNGILVPVGDVVAMSSALLKMINNFSSFRNGIEFVGDYSSDAAVDRFASFFDSL